MAQSCRKRGSILLYEHAHVLTRERRGVGKTVRTTTKMILGVKYAAPVQEERTLVNLGAIKQLQSIHSRVKSASLGPTTQRFPSDRVQRVTSPPTRHTRAKRIKRRASLRAASVSNDTHTLHSFPFFLDQKRSFRGEQLTGAAFARRVQGPSTAGDK